MELSYIRLDDRLDAVQLAELRAPEWAQRDFRRKFQMSWLYHELSLEGVILTARDIERALAGSEGRDYCDGELLKRVRRYRDAIQRLQRASTERKPITRGTLLEYQAILCGHQPRNPIRIDDGATEQYKHDVFDPADVEPALKELCADLKNQAFATHPIELAIDVQYRLTRIWPFDEHSAAVARLVANQILYTNGYPPALIHAQDRQKYYHALHYDARRLRDLVLESLRGQIETRERLFAEGAGTRLGAGATRLAS